MHTQVFWQSVAACCKYTTKDEEQIFQKWLARWEDGWIVIRGDVPWPAAADSYRNIAASVCRDKPMLPETLKGVLATILAKKQVEYLEDRLQEELPVLARRAWMKILRRENYRLLGLGKDGKSDRKRNGKPE